MQSPNENIPCRRVNSQDRLTLRAGGRDGRPAANSLPLQTIDFMPSEPSHFMSHSAPSLLGLVGPPARNVMTVKILSIMSPGKVRGKSVSIK